MIGLLLAIVYITVNCNLWGTFITSRLRPFSPETTAGTRFIVSSVVGLAVITALAGFLSLLIPLGKWWVQLFILIPSVILAARHSNILTIKYSWLPARPLLVLLLVAYSLLIIIIGSWTIIHDDTLGYHAQTIRWIEEYKAVPGIVNLHSRYGYQGLWYVTTALFSFDFLGLAGINFLNSTVVIWFGIFVIDRLSHHSSVQGSRYKLFSWLALLAISMACYTQIRLTVTSASADFIAVLIIWLIFYIFLSENKLSTGIPDRRLMLVVLLCSFCISVKLSSAPLLLFIFYAFFVFIKRRRFAKLMVVFSIGLLFAIPFCTRNIISSGYLIFPSVIPDLVNVDWKYSKNETIYESQYITSYARLKHHQKTDVVMRMSLSEWMPKWWALQSLPDKCLLGLIPLSIICAILLFKRWLTRELEFIAVLVALSGIVFWFITAPDPRFGYGFLVMLPAILLANLFSGSLESQQTIKRTSNILFIAFTAILLSYSTYRLTRFFDRRQLILPMGMDKPVYKTVIRQGIELRVVENRYCNDLPIPCIYDSLINAEPRGSTIADGFRPKTNH